MLAKFKLGDQVRIRIGAPPGHFRTPSYVQGKIGRVEAIHGEFRNPETLAYGKNGLPKQFLYLVSLAQTHIWDTYTTGLQDRLFIDIYEHWLEPVEN